MDFIRRMTAEETGDSRPLWEVDVSALFEFAQFALSASEVRALADWIDHVTGGGNDQAATLREALDRA